MNEPWATLAMVWFIVCTAWAFLLFGIDKWQANRGGRRVTEATLCWVSAVGGWPGGFLGMVVFRHKSAKGSFQLKFAGAFFVWAGLVYAAWRSLGGSVS